MQDSLPLSGCCPASSPRLAPAAAPPRAGSGWHRRRDTVRWPNANEALMPPGNRDTGEGELMHSVVPIQKPPQPGPTSGTASLGVQPGGPHACVTPPDRQHPSSPALSPPRLSLVCFLSAKAGQAGAEIRAHPWVFHRLPLQKQPEPRHVRPGAEHGAGTASVWLPPPTPRPREGSERLAAACTAAAADGNPSSGTSPLLTPGFPSRLGGPIPTPSAQLEDTGSGIRAAEEGSRICANASTQYPWLVPAMFWGEQERAASVQPLFNPSQPLARAPSLHSGSPAPNGQGTPTSLTSKKRRSSIS